MHRDIDDDAVMLAPSSPRPALSDKEPTTEVMKAGLLRVNTYEGSEMSLEELEMAIICIDNQYESRISLSDILGLNTEPGLNQCRPLPGTFRAIHGGRAGKGISVVQ